MMKEEENLAANEAKNQMVHTILFSRATGTGIHSQDRRIKARVASQEEPAKDNGPCAPIQ